MRSCPCKHGKVLRHAFYRLEEHFSCLLSQDIEALPVSSKSHRRAGQESRLMLRSLERLPGQFFTLTARL